MKKILLVLLLAFGYSTTEAQELTWLNNLDKAIEASKETGRPIMLFFTGSDWCGWCRRLQNEVFTQPEFAAWASQNVVLMEVDFPRHTPLSPELQLQNSQLQQFFKVPGYPSVIFVTAKKADGKINFESLGNTGYIPGGPTPWLNAANGILKKK